MRILLVQPPVQDFSAYDFWLRPQGLLRVAGQLRGRTEMELFDFLDRSALPVDKTLRSDEWGRGEFPGEIIPKPAAFAKIPRRFKRFGRRRGEFQEFLAGHKPADAALVATGMTYWYGGVREVIEDLRRCWPSTKIVLGGIYSTICPDHARRQGADLVVEGDNLEPLWQLLGVRGDPNQPAAWETYGSLSCGAIQLTDGCPFRCTYCCSQRLHAAFSVRPTEASLAELDLLLRQGAQNIAFYDDALLYQPERALVPFLEEICRRGPAVNLHTPNALHARLLTKELAAMMVRAGVRTFCLGFESGSEDWQRATGGKVFPEELQAAVEHLKASGAEARNIAAYVMLGHPSGSAAQTEQSIRVAHAMGIRVMLAEFSPIPGTPDGEALAGRLDLSEPLNHNKTAWAIALLGNDEANRLKLLCKGLNKAIRSGI